MSVRGETSRVARFASAAACLRAQKREILQIWERQVRLELAAAEGQSHVLLLDSMPEFIDQLACSLDTHGESVCGLKTVSQAHATQRSAIPGFSLAQVATEYTILRQVIFEVLEHHVQLSIVERDVILDFIGAGKMAAVEQYMLVANRKVAESEERLNFALSSAGMRAFDWDLKTGNFSDKVASLFERIHPDDTRNVDSIIKDALAEKRDYEIQYRSLKPDGAVRWIMAKGRVHSD